MTPLALPLLSAALSAANIDVKPGEKLFEVLSTLSAGDRVTIHGGRYKVPGYVALELRGTASAPIVIQGKPGDEVVVEGISSQNTFNLAGSWFTLQGLKIEGGSHGVRLGSCDHVTLQDLEITGVGDVGISCNYPNKTCEAITIRRNHIHHTGQSGGPGECMYLGCNDNACQMWDSIIEYNWCHDTTAGSQGDGIELKTGSYNNIIRHNVIHNVKYPAITVYATVDHKPANLVEANVIWAVQDNGIQMVGDAKVQNNVIFDVKNYALQIKPSQGGVVDKLSVLHNTVINPGSTCLRASELEQGSHIHIANNALFCKGGTALKVVGGPANATIESNAGVGSTEGISSGFVSVGEATQAMLDPGGKNTYPSPSSKLRDAGSPSSLRLDFNCRTRDASKVDIGAYEHGPDANPGWVPRPGFKTCGLETSTGSEDDTNSGDATSSTGTSDPTSGSGNEDTATSDNTSDDAASTTRDDVDAPQDGGATSPGCGCTSQDTRKGWLFMPLLICLGTWIRARQSRSL